MTDNQKVYIRGVEGHGGEVIKTLTDLGAENLWKRAGSDPEHIYYISPLGVLQEAEDGSEAALMVKEYCREIKLPEQWKDGDILYDENDDVFAVVRDIHGYISTHIAINNGEIEKDFTFPKEDFCLATPSEVERFHDLLHRHGKEWDAEKKQLVDWRWKPKRNEEYWAITPEGDIDLYRWEDTIDDSKYYDFGNCFGTNEEAEAMAEKVKKLLKGENA